MSHLPPEIPETRRRDASREVFYYGDWASDTEHGPEVATQPAANTGPRGGKGSPSIPEPPPEHWQRLRERLRERLEGDDWPVAALPLDPPKRPWWRRIKGWR